MRRLVASAMLLVACAWAGPIAAGRAFAFDYSRYRPGQLRDIADEIPHDRDLTVTTDVPVRTPVSYLGEIRPLQKDSRRLIGAWEKATGVPGVLDMFRREVKVRQRSLNYWLPVQEPVAATMLAELAPGDEIEVFTICIGRVAGRALFLVNAFGHLGNHRHP